MSIFSRENRAIFFNLSVIVVALGYFVDIFDLTLFNMVRRQSLMDIGIPESELVDKGMFLLNTQMVGMLVGGILWGQLGDRRGRTATLFASIILYSVANILNAFVTTYEQYTVLRFIAGVGLAGELGVGITLIAELLPKEKRGLGTMFVAAIGVSGAVLGGIMVEILDWRVCYIIGGVMGLGLLFLRMSIKDSGLYNAMHAQEGINKGRFLDFFRSKSLFKRLVLCTLVGAPLWYVAGIVMPFSPELGRDLGVSEELKSSRTIAILYLGLTFGDFFSGWLSQHLRSRRHALWLFQLGCVVSLAALFFTTAGRGEIYFYSLTFIIGIFAGFWALFVTVAAESFGTNIRSTAATSIPNFVRASVVPMSLVLMPLREYLPYWQATMYVGIGAFVISFVAIYFLRETFGISLDYNEEARKKAVK